MRTVFETIGKMVSVVALLAIFPCSRLKAIETHYIRKLDPIG